jgi:hypothetical protein
MDQDRISIVYSVFLKALITFLETPIEENRAPLFSLAKTTGEVDRDELFFAPRRDLSKGFDEMLEKLKAKDPKEWILIIYRALGTLKKEDFRRLKSISPFSGDMILQLTTEGVIEGELVDLLRGVIQSRGLKETEWCFITIPGGLNIDEEKIKVISMEER